jgi:hypothetical protein
VSVFVFTGSTIFVIHFRWLNEMQSLRSAAESDASECERLRATLQKQEEQQLLQQQQFAKLLETLELENRRLRELQVLSPILTQL